jgi:hypothetical protein
VILPKLKFWYTKVSRVPILEKYCFNGIIKPKESYPKTHLHQNESITVTRFGFDFDQKQL